jgi:NADH-quinone oxidoreductase subunit C
MTLELARESAKRLTNRHGDQVESIFEDKRGVVVRVTLKGLIDVLSALKEDSEIPFDMLIDATAVDWSTWQQETGLKPPEGRFSLYYNLYSSIKRVRIFVEVNLKEKQSAPTATGLWAAADWSEREIFDMFGIRFSGHPDLRRILMPDDFEGYPLRKEFPLQGQNPQDFPQE